MSNSSLVSYTRLIPYCDKPRRDRIRKITIHHMAGNLSLETCGNVLNNNEFSANYGIDSSGRVGLYVDETNRAWTSANRANDDQAITIEVANCGGAPDWPVSAAAYAALIELCVDICKRNGIDHLNYTGDASGNLTRHNMFYATACPGQYLQARFPAIAEEVNRRLQDATPTTTSGGGNAPLGTLYRVQVGAFKQRENADRKEAELRAAGYDTYMVQVGGLYKVQTGAFEKKANAERRAAELKAKGFDVYITTQAGQAAPPAPAAQPALKVGDIVKIRPGAMSYDDVRMYDFVYERKYRIDSIDGNRVLLDENGLCTAFRLDDLIRV